MKTQKQKKAAIDKLEQFKIDMPEYSLFRDPVHQGIDAQIEVIKNDMDEEAVIEKWGEEYDEDTEPNYITQKALDAVSWLDGEMELTDLIE